MGDSARWRVDVVLIVGLAVAAVGFPQARCAERPTNAGAVVRGNPTLHVVFQPAYGDLPVTASTGPSGR